MGGIGDRALDSQSPTYYNQDFEYGTHLILVDGDGKQTDDYSISADDLHKLIDGVKTGSLQQKAGTWSDIVGVLTEVQTHLNNSLKYLAEAKWTGDSADLAKKTLTQLHLSSGNTLGAGSKLSDSLTKLADAFGGVHTDANHVGDPLSDGLLGGPGIVKNLQAFSGNLAAVHRSIYDGVNRALDAMPKSLASNVPTSDGSGQRPYPPDGNGLTGPGTGPGTGPSTGPGNTGPHHTPTITTHHPDPTIIKHPQPPHLIKHPQPPHLITNPKEPKFTDPTYPDPKYTDPQYPGTHGGPSVGDGGNLAGLGSGGGGLGGGGSLGGGGAGLGPGGGSLNGGALNGGASGAGAGIGAGAGAAGGAGSGAAGSGGGFSPAGVGAGGGGGGAGGGQDRDRGTWLSEDEDVWGRDQHSIPGVV